MINYFQISGRIAGMHACFHIPSKMSKIQSKLVHFIHQSTTMTRKCRGVDEDDSEPR